MNAPLHSAAPTGEDHDPAAGAKNLLTGCLGAKPGERILIVREEPGLGFYDAAAPECVLGEAEAMGCQPSTFVCPQVEGPEGVPPALWDAVTETDHTVFFHRVGDQMRFREMPGGGSKTMSYALDIGFLGSSFCRLPQDLMQAVLAKLEAVLAGATDWRLTCPRGSDITGPLARPGPSAREGFTLKLFPIMIFDPIPCQGASGRLVITHWLMPTGTHSYEPENLMLDEPVTVIVDQGRIADFEGPPALVAKVWDHYRHVAGLFGIDPRVVHSWHSGIHPRTYYPGPARDNIERWGGVAFANPRYTHFHTCGEAVPGEIAWSLFDATIAIGGEVLWDQGRFVFLERDDVRALLRDYPGSEQAFEMRWDIGI